ncbi:hypothetical protein SEUCBS140593_007049 [Sporothrix eucalyptigena]|uniref:Uncharacterized protein n=1 Tax=Sporothrix eucalyptigena TaxID=1812306 RepID=A0ABP0CA01_9PEZI
MAAQGALGQGYRLGPRVPSGVNSFAEQATRVVGGNIPSRILARSSASSTCDKDGGNLCEKPESGGNLTLPIVLGVVIPLVVIAGVLLYLHRRNVKRLRKEDTNDPHKSLDFGMAMNPSKQNVKSKRKSSFFGGEKDMFAPKSRQLSMDMNLSSPYLLPPELQNSRESLHSLARTLHQNEDPYRPVNQYAGSDAASVRSFQKDGASIRTGASAFDDRSRANSAMGSRMAPPRPSRLSAGPNSPRARSPLPPSDMDSVPASEPMKLPTPPPPVEGANGFVFEPAFPAAEMAAEAQPRVASPIEADGNGVPAVAELQAPEPAVTKISRKGLPVSPRPQDQTAPVPNHRSTTGTVDEPFIYDSPNRGLRQDSSTYADFDLKLDAPNRESRDEPLSSSLPKLTLGGPFDDETFLPGQATTIDDQTHPHIEYPAEGQQAAPAVIEPHQFGELFPDEPGHDDEDSRGRALHRRQSSEYPQDNTIRQSALGLPQMDTRRLSVGFRPLPPDELIESEDPETRANRIRSFYKEYFDESKLDMAEYNQHYPPQGVPAEWRNAPGGNAQGNNGGQYYEDYDQSYHPGDAGAYFDPQSNSFVMPYAQPVQRRAMTPPPSGSRFPGGRPRGGPRPFHGSMGGGMGGPGGPMGMSRPGSSMSSQFGPRPGSSLSSRQYPGSRSASNMSGRFGGPRKPIPPPEDLITLPTPSKLKDDSFSLVGDIDFAPPPTLRDQARGRSQSPLGERRPYQKTLPTASPLVSSFDEMAALPSPHLLRKSSTFTGLDFAPPRKFKDSDTMSDAGSIRSNRSGISAINQAAIRSGAGRVSRLPGDNVFTQAAMADQLKPSWGFRP